MLPRFLSRATPKLEFFTEHEPLLSHPPVPASRFLPEWFRRQKPSFPIEPNQRYPFGVSSKLQLSNVNATIKRCPGILSYLSEGYIIPLWSDFVVQVRNDTIYAMGSHQHDYVSLHGRHIHFDAMPERPDYYKDAVKFFNPWCVKAPKGWSVLLTAPFYHMEDRFVVCPGVVDADSYHRIHVNTFFRKGPADHKLKMGMPFVQVIPFQREALELEVRQATDEDNKRLERLRFRIDRFFEKTRTLRSDPGADD